MTKEEIIMRGKQLGFPRLSKKSHDNQATMIATIVEEAVRLEREACAKICDKLQDDIATEPKHCAESIRARGGQQ
jgi:hypothetical protein